MASWIKVRGLSHDPHHPRDPIQRVPATPKSQKAPDETSYWQKKMAERHPQRQG